MRRTPRSLLLAGALVAGAIAPAAAGGSLDYGAGISPYNGIDPYSVATPVPAPIPVPVYEPAWYFRADFAAGFGSDPSVTALGTPFANGTIGFSPLWAGESFEPSFTGGVGVGYIWGPHVRTDLTVDIHSIMSAEFHGSVVYLADNLETLTVDDKTKFMSTILLLNAYYDIRTGTAFTPYLGAGLGFAVNQLTRNVTWTDTNPLIADGAFGDRSTDVKFAAAAMLGFYYDFSSFVALDVNYRYLHIGGSSVDLNILGFGSKVDVGDLNEHQIRAGLRFYVN